MENAPAVKPTSGGTSANGSQPPGKDRGRKRLPRTCDPGFLEGRCSFTNEEMPAIGGLLAAGRIPRAKTLRPQAPGQENGRHPAGHWSCDIPRRPSSGRRDSVQGNHRVTIFLVHRATTANPNISATLNCGELD